MYIKRFTNARFSMMNYYQPRNRQSDRYALLANNTYLNSPKDDVKLVSKLVKLFAARSDSFGFVQTSLCRYFIPI